MRYKLTLLSACFVFIFGFVLLSADVSHAQTLKKLAVLELANSAEISVEEANYLTDMVRGEASRQLPSKYFMIMTRESIHALLPPGTNLAKCTNVECEVQIGRKIGADYIITGEIIRFSGKFRVVLKAHHSLSGAFLGEKTARGKVLDDLENTVRSAAADLIFRIRNHAKIPGEIVPLEEDISIGTGGKAWSPNIEDEVIVQFDSTPVGATVEIKDQPLCETPCSRPIAPGMHQVAMKKLKYKTKREFVEVTKGMKNINWNLDENFGRLTVRSEPAGMSVKINEKNIGKTPIVDHMLDPGRYDVLVYGEKYYENGKRIQLMAGEKEMVSATLTPRNGAMKIKAVDDNQNAVAGDVYINGKQIGHTYETITLLIGKHNVEVNSEKGFWAGTVEVTEAQVNIVDALIKGGTISKTSKQKQPSRKEPGSRSSSISSSKFKYVELLKKYKKQETNGLIAASVLSAVGAATLGAGAAIGGKGYDDNGDTSQAYQAGYDNGIANGTMLLGGSVLTGGITYVILTALERKRLDHEIKNYYSLSDYAIKKSFKRRKNGKIGSQVGGGILLGVGVLGVVLGVMNQSSADYNESEARDEKEQESRTSLYNQAGLWDGFGIMGGYVCGTLGIASGIGLLVEGSSKKEIKYEENLLRNVTAFYDPKRKMTHLTWNYRF